GSAGEPFPRADEDDGLDGRIGGGAIEPSGEVPPQGMAEPVHRRVVQGNDGHRAARLVFRTAHEGDPRPGARHGSMAWLDSQGIKLPDRIQPENSLLTAKGPVVVSWRLPKSRTIPAPVEDR